VVLPILNVGPRPKKVLIISMNKKELLTKLKDIEGLSKDEKAYLTNLINTKKKYGLVWEDKPETVEEELRHKLPILKEVRERAIINDSESEKKPNHILIEGDNLHALTALTFTHENKIDLIYIDPPYNTGNKDFVYNDTYVDKDDAFKHSKWLAFIAKRLKIAKNLLKEDGVIFISIDDNEDAALKMLCDEIFGESNFLGRLIWFKKRKGSFLSNYVISMTEYILPYRKSNQLDKLYGAEPNKNETQPLIKRTNSTNILFFPEQTIKTKLKDGFYEKGSYGKGTSSTSVLNNFNVKSGIIQDELKLEAPFIWSQEFLDEELEKGSEIYINTKNIQPRALRKNSTSIKAFSSFIDGREFSATNEDAYDDLKRIFKTDRPFQYSKPKELIKKLIRSKSFFDDELTVLDFMAGSGTTLHALMDLNQEDDLGLKGIIVTNNENNIAEEITYERNKRVIQGYTDAKGNKVEGLKNNNLRYYKCDFVESAKSEYNRRLLTRASVQLLSIKEDCYIDKTQELGWNDKEGKIFNCGHKYLIVVFHNRNMQAVVEKVIQIIKEIPQDKTIKLYGFSPEKETLREDFIDVADRIDAVPLPEAIYNAYRNTFRTIGLSK